MNETPQEYTQRILGLMAGKEPLEVQRETAKALAKLINSLSKKQLSQRPAPGKWSITEILAHLADSEIVLSWRMRAVICQNGAAMQARDQDVWSETLDYAGQEPNVSLETFRLLRENNLRMLEALPENLWENYTEQLNGVRVSANLFETLGVPAVLGRTLEREDDQPGAPRVVVMSYGLWQRRFGADPKLVGKQLELNDASYTLVGILPPNFFFPIPGAELAVPLVPDTDPQRFNRNTVNFLRMVGRIRSGGHLIRHKRK